MKLCVIPGDGIGHEVVPVAVGVLQAVLPVCSWYLPMPAGKPSAHGKALPDKTLEAARECGAVFLVR
jgi:homoisocitrate dehydrogenase